MTKADKEGQRKAPILRFKGFTDDWEQRKLVNIFSKIRNAFVGKVTDYYVDRGFIYLESNNIKNGGINLNTKKYINNEFYYQQKEKWLHTNDIVMVQSGDVGQTAVIPSNLNNTAAHALIMFQEIDSNINPYFLNYQFQSYRCIKQIQIISKGNTVKHVLASDMKEFTVFLASLKEQINVADFLNKLNRIIDLYERKLKLLSQVKKYFLDNLFTEKEYPNLRFKGFTDAWEQRKLGEVTLFIRNGVTVKQNGSYGIPITRIESISTGTLNLKKVGYADIQTDKYKDFYLKNNDILFSNINSLEHIGKTAFVQHLSLDVIHGMNLLNIRINEESISSKFIYYQLLIMKYNNLFKRVAKPAVNQASIATSELKKLVIKIPDVNEQHKIQALLTRLERIITLYENKQQSLSEIKKTLLNTMFI